MQAIFINFYNKKIIACIHYLNSNVTYTIHNNLYLDKILVKHSFFLVTSVMDTCMRLG